MTLRLDDRSVKVPRGVIEDVLIEVDKFIYPVDFVVLDTQPVQDPSAQIPVILGRPFLATANAVINCRTGLMNISFGNMTTELNVFNVTRQPSENDDLEEVNMISTLVQDNWLDTLLADSLDDFEETILLDQMCDQSLEEALEYFKDSEDPEIQAIVRGLSENTDYPKFGGSNGQLSPLEVPNLGLKPSASEVSLECIQTPQPDPPDNVQEKIYMLETRFSDESVCRDTHMKPNWALQINPVVLRETLDQVVLYLLIFLILSICLLFVAVLFGLMDPQLFRLLVYDFGR